MSQLSQQNSNQAEFVEFVTNPSTEENVLVSKEEFDKLRKEFGGQKKISNLTLGFIAATLLVCFLSFVTFILDAYKMHNESYIEYSKNIEALKTKNFELQIQMLELKIEKLERQNQSNSNLKQ